MKKKFFSALIVFLTFAITLVKPVSAFANQQLTLLPENNRYFQYKGLPFVSFCNVADVTIIPRAEYVSESDIKNVTRYGNHFYMKANSKTTRATFLETYNHLNNEGHWNKVRSIARWAYENDVVLSILGFWSYSWNFADQCFRSQPDSECSGGDRSLPKGSDMLREIGDPLLDQDLSEYDLPPGTTRMDLHRLAIEKAVEATWEYPNVVYNLMWEYGIVADFDADGSFHRWWVETIKSAGATINPNIDHLFSIQFGGENYIDSSIGCRPCHPSLRNAEFITMESGSGFNWDPKKIPNDTYNLAVPLVPYHSDMYDHDAWSSGGNYRFPEDFSDTEWFRQYVVRGLHVGENFLGAANNVKNYFLQARWYLENIKTWGDEQFSRAGGSGDEINEQNLPHYVSSSRPTLTNPSGFTRGAKVNGNTVDFSVIYRDSNNDPPVQAEVWVDRNGDGRFNPKPSRDERITMQGAGTDYRNGVTFSVSGVTATYNGTQDLGYVFRFADQHWYPPEIGIGVIPNTWYDHRTLANFPGLGSHSSAPTVTPTSTPTPAPPSFKQLLLNWLTDTFDQNSDGKVNAVDFTQLLP